MYPHWRFDSFASIEQAAYLTALVQRLALTRPHDHIPLDFEGLTFLALVHAPVACIGKNIAFLPVQELTGLGLVANARCPPQCAPAQSLYPRQCALSSRSATGCFFALVDFGVAFARAVLGGAGRGNRGGINGRTLFEQIAFGASRSLTVLRNYSAKLMLFQQMAKFENAHTVRQLGHAVQTRKVALHRSVKEYLFHGHVAQAKPLLHEMNAQHGAQRKGWATCPGYRRMRLNERQQLRPRYYLCSISSSNTRLRVRRLLRSMTRLVCFMPVLLPAASIHTIRMSAGF
jgi:hypothetical protein